MSPLDFTTRSFGLLNRFPLYRRAIAVFTKMESSNLKMPRLPWSAI